MSRSSWKLPFYNKFILKYLDDEKLCSTDVIRMSPVKTTDRNSTVSEVLLNHKIAIHNGQTFERVVIRENHFGSKLGSLVLTKQIGANLHLYNKIQKKKKEKQRLLKQKKLSRNKGVKLKKSQKLTAKQKRKKEI